MTGLTNSMFARPPVYVRRCDLGELWRIAAAARRTAPEAGLFLEEFDRLSVAPATSESEFVRLNSSVVYKDLRTRRVRRVQVVRPGSENAENNEISVLSQIGGALVGLTAGAIFRWPDTDGRTRAIKVLEITQDASS